MGMPCFAEQFGHRLVGRQHELLDHLVALGVFHDMRPGHAALGVEIDLHLRHRQHQRTVADAAAAEQHRQLVHAGQQRVDRRRQSPLALRERVRVRAL